MIHQAIYTAKEGGGFVCQARSPGFEDAWSAPAEQICADFGSRPTPGPGPTCVFALPLVRRHIAIVQAGPLTFRFLVLTTAAYAELDGDLFHIADAFPPDWAVQGVLPTLDLPAAPPHRTVAVTQAVLNVPHSATLLGGVQVLVDGGKLVFERAEPDEQIVRSLWALLPVSNRCELRPATFAYGNALRFDIVVVQRAEEADFAGYVTEAAVGDIPTGRYEHTLQSVIEHADVEDVPDQNEQADPGPLRRQQEALDNLFARRTRGQTLRLGVIMLVLLIALPLTNLFCGPPPPPASTTTTEPPKFEGR